jgi:hypothetical protein
VCAQWPQLLLSLLLLLLLLQLRSQFQAVGAVSYINNSVVRKRRESGHKEFKGFNRRLEINCIETSYRQHKKYQIKKYVQPIEWMEVCTDCVCCSSPIDQANLQPRLTAYYYS